MISHIGKIQENLPELKEKIQKKTDRLKAINHENLELIDELNSLEKQEDIIGRSFNRSQDITLAEEKLRTSMIDDNGSNTLGSKLKYTEYGKRDSSILNITKYVDEDNELKEKSENLRLLKAKWEELSKEDHEISKKVADKNSAIFSTIKMFTEGTKEISRELLKIHEIQLDKVITSKRMIKGRKLAW